MRYTSTTKELKNTKEMPYFGRIKGNCLKCPFPYLRHSRLSNRWGIENGIHVTVFNTEKLGKETNQMEIEHSMPRP